VPSTAFVEAAVHTVEPGDSARVLCPLRGVRVALGWYKPCPARQQALWPEATALEGSGIHLQVLRKSISDGKESTQASSFTEHVKALLWIL